MSSSLGIIDYGAGNIRSILNALEKVGADGELVTDANNVGRYNKIILPGVGAFERAIANLRERGMADALDKHIKDGKPLMGICLGMQLMCKESMEGGQHKGLGWVDATVKCFSEDMGLKVPHMGWNEIRITKEHPVAAGFEDGSDAYFVHSYYVDCQDNDDLLFSCEYGRTFAAGFAKDNIVGLQFHPEKSQTVGLRMLANFLQTS